MVRTGIVESCTGCASKKKGSCCFQGVEEWYDHILLLINLLMGAELPRDREAPGHCLFVGEKGCKLIARYSFCINYLCPDLKKSLGKPYTEEIMSIVGEELVVGLEVEQAVRILIS